MTDETKDDGSSITFKVPSKAVIAIVLALAGFAWNKYESYSNAQTTSQVDKAAFDYLQLQVRDLRREVHQLRRLYKGQSEVPSSHLLSSAVSVLSENVAAAHLVTESLRSESTDDHPVAYTDIVQQIQDAGSFDIRSLKK